MGEASWIGVDLGTQSVRAVRVAASGAVLGRAARPLTSSHPDAERHEQDPLDWFAAVDATLSEVADPSVDGIAICSTSGTVLLTDGTGHPLTPALMYDDARAAAELPRIVAADPARWSTAMQPTWALPKILWLAAHQAAGSQLAHNGNQRAGWRIAHSADAVAAQLTGHPVATDTSHALKTGYDLVAGTWPYDAFDRLGLARESFPDVVLPGARLGLVSAAKAQLTGVPEGTPVYAGMTDGCAAQIAAGALAPGSWNSVLGTTLVLKGVSRDLLDDPTGAVYSHRHPDGGWLPGGASNTGAGALTAMLPGADLDAFDRQARELGPIDAAIYPITKRGERFPFVAPDATSFELGDLPDDLHRYAGVLQGVAFIERLAFEHLVTLGAEPVGSVSLTGGAVRSGYWNQLRADVLGVPVELPATPDPAYGMAILAASEGGSVTETAARMVKVANVLEPHPQGRLEHLCGEFVAELDRRGYLG
ncbi:carbohydrate kinase [Kribbella qitaiheensis]|uniref:Carbohydrate kinase n=1 Tax=Kribbella qitaiheensis TaxID=1544730 RepID=A0A7G6WZN8_9ACTN|nr:FGGY family carbohydrate kinase [Kribbella qitaiheensis]QNE19453.1 carbohydrate kinase [Kribbella qitaiheensis]